MMRRNTQSEAGLSLVEFMVAMLLGTILIGGAASIYLASLRSYTESERSMGIGEGGRFALMLINDSLRHAGYMGGVQGQDVAMDASLGAVGSDCSAEGAAYNLDNFVFADEASASGQAFTCITDAMPLTDVLIVKHLLPDPIFDNDPNNPGSANGVLDWPTALDSEVTYVVTNGENAILLDGADTAPAVGIGEEYANGTAWPYAFQIYYVRDRDPDPNDEDPWLARKVLRWTGGAMNVVTEDLVEGVEDMVFWFGYDSNLDGIPDTFGDEDDVSNDNRWGSVTSVETFILVSSRDPDFAYQDDKTYRLANETFTPATDDPDRVNYIRSLVSSSIALRNPRLFMVNGP